MNHNKFIENARKIRAMVTHHPFDHVSEREERKCEKCIVLNEFDRAATMLDFQAWVITLPPPQYKNEEMCHHQHPLKPPGVAMFSHPKSEPCPLRKVKRKRKK